MQLGLAGKVALVAGAGRGLGRAVAVALGTEGARVALVARTLAELEVTAQAVRAAGGEATAVPADLTDERAVTAALGVIEATLGPPTILVWSAASFFTPARLHTVPPTELRRVLDLDLVAPAALVQRLLPGMMLAAHGRVVLVGSLAARGGVRGGTAYAAAKAGLLGLARGVAADYGRYGITANVVTLSFVDTERLALRLGGSAEARDRLTRATATRRIPTPAECAAPIVFLCSGPASAVTGAELEATGGAHLNTLV